MTKCERWLDRRGLLVLAVLVCAGCAEDDSAALSVVDYDDGLVRFVDADANPRQVYSLRGEMTLTVYENYVRVVLDDDDQTYFIPRERLIYAGIEIK
jgi:hypothetical protein